MIIDYVSNIHGKTVISISMVEEHIKLSPNDPNKVDCVNVLFEATCSDGSIEPVIVVTSEHSQMVIPANEMTLKDAFDR